MMSGKLPIIKLPVPTTNENWLSYELSSGWKDVTQSPLTTGFLVDASCSSRAVASAGASY
jgi:hypothetical protein